MRRIPHQRGSVPTYELCMLPVPVIFGVISIDILFNKFGQIYFGTERVCLYIVAHINL